MDIENDDALFAYLLAQGQLTPEQEQLIRQQQQVDALRQQSTDMPQTQMMGRVAVAPHWTQALGKVAQGLSAGYQQKKVDAASKELNTKRGADLVSLLSSMRGGNASPAAATDETAQRQRNAAQYGVPLTDEEIRRRQMGMESL